MKRIATLTDTMIGYYCIVFYNFSFSFSFFSLAAAAVVVSVRKLAQNQITLEHNEPRLLILSKARFSFGNKFRLAFLVPHSRTIYLDYYRVNQNALCVCVVVVVAKNDEEKKATALRRDIRDGET